MMTDSLPVSSTVFIDVITLPHKSKKTKRTLSLSQELDYKIRVLAANKRISVGSLVEDALVLYFSQTSQENTEL